MTGADRTLLVASSDRLFAEAAAAYLDGQPGWRTVATTTDGLQALAAVARLEPEVVLVLGDVARLAPAALAQQVRRRWPATRVVVLGRQDAAGASMLPPAARAAEVLAALAQPQPGDAGAPEPAPERPAGVELLRALTRRELRILKLLAEGLSMREVGAALKVSEHTVRTHMQNLYAKLGCHSRLDVVRFAAAHGLVGGEAGESGPTRSQRDGST